VALRGGFGARFAAQEAKITCAPIGSASPTANGSGSYNGRADSSIGFGARAGAVVERDDGLARFLHLMSTGRVFLQKKNLHVDECWLTVVFALKAEVYI